MRQNYYRENCLVLSGTLFGTVGNVVWHYRECCLALSGILLSVCPNGWDYLSQWVGQMLSILFCAYFYRPFHSLSLPHHFLLFHFIRMAPLPLGYSLYTFRQMEAQQKPEGLKRLQAGVKPLQKRVVTLAPKGRQNVLPPLRGLFTPRLFTGVSPLSVVSMPLRGYPSEMCIKSSPLGREGDARRIVLRRLSSLSPSCVPLVASVTLRDAERKGGECRAV